MAAIAPDSMGFDDMRAQFKEAVDLRKNVGQAPKDLDKEQY